MVSAKDLEVDLDTDLSSMLSRKAPGASRNCIRRLTILCVANVEFEAIFIPKIHAHFRKTPNTHKLGVLYVIDLVTRGWLLQARVNKQDLSRPAPEGTYVAAVHRVTQLLSELIRTMDECAPNDQKEKIRKLLDIWDAGKDFSAEILENCRQVLTPRPHTSTPCARSEGSRRLHPFTAYTPAKQHHSESSTSLPKNPPADIPSPAQRHQSACAPEVPGPVEHRGSSTPGGVGSIFHQNTAVLPDHAALWISKSAASIMSQPAYLSKSGQPWSSESEVTQWTGKDVETATCSVGGGPCLELPLQSEIDPDSFRERKRPPSVEGFCDDREIQAQILDSDEVHDAELSSDFAPVTTDQGWNVASLAAAQILMLSGIGSREELRKNAIGAVLANDHVGKMLKDHLCSSPIQCKTRAGFSLDYLSNEVKAIPALVQWLLFGTGPLTSNVGEAAAFVRSFEHGSAGSTDQPPKDYSSGKNAPDLEIVGAPFSFSHHGEERPVDQAGVFSFVPICLRPQSKGTVSLKSTDVFDHPIIDPEYLTDEEDNDKRVLIAGLRLCLKIMRSPSFERYFEPVPTDDDQSSYWWPYSCSDPASITDEQLGRFLIERAFTLYHPVGSARMGPSPSDSVVDLKCRVHGTNGLRIVDASIFPEQISGHPTAPIAAIAHKVSEMIAKA